MAQAYFLFYHPKRREWDGRGEVYVRYGPPQRADYNPLGRSLNFVFGGGSGVPVGVAFPMNVLVWDYPDLGMQVVMQDRILSEYYTLPVSYTSDPDPVPDPEVLKRRTDALATAGGRGVFPTLPPGVEPLPIEGVVARFEGDRSPRLLAQVETSGEPADSLWAEWVVLDTSRTEVARGRRTLSPSACEAIEHRVGDFAAELPPGGYLVGLTVRDAKGRRGVFRNGVDLAPVGSALGLSDVVISCGEPMTADRMSGTPAVRIEPNPGARISGSDPLTAYFEIYHLTPDRDGQSRFEYTYTVRSTEKDPRIWIKRLFQPRPQPPPISASRETENPGSLRRQFVTVPIQSLPSGHYRLEIRVRDLIAGNEASRNADFVKLGGPTLRN